MRALLRLHAPSGPALWLVLGRGVGFVAMFVVPVVLVRLFDQATFGTYKQLFLVYGTLYGLAQLGVAESLYYFIPRRPSEAGKYAANAMGTLAVAGVACAAALTLAAPMLGSWMMNPGLAGTLPLLGAFLALMLTSALFEIVLVARVRYQTAAWIYASSDLARASFLLAAALAIGGVRGLLWGAVGFAAARVLVMLWLLARGLEFTLRPSLTLWREQWVYTVPFALAVAVDVVQANLHNYVVAARFDPATFAIYAVGCLQIPLVDVLTTSSANVMMVAMARDGIDRRVGDALALWHDTTRRLALIIFPIVAFLVALAPQVITVLFTGRYLASVPVFQLWTCSLVLAVPCVDAVLRACADTRFLLGLNLLRLLMVVLLITWCLDRFGLPGAVLVMLISTAATRALAVVRICRLTGARTAAVLPWRALATTTLCALAAAVPALAFARAFPLPAFASLIGAAVIYAVVYAGLSLRLLAGASAGPVLPALQNAR
jgi:O-antigen/teichoic acid export membrane protein